jgi:hypothetical protein
MICPECKVLFQCGRCGYIYQQLEVNPKEIIDKILAVVDTEDFNVAESPKDDGESVDSKRRKILLEILR